MDFKNTSDMIAAVDNIFNSDEFKIENIDNIYDSLNSFDYTGYNALTICNEVMKKEPDLNVLKSDLLRLFTLIDKRGTVYSKSKVKMSAEGQAIVDSLVSKYSIKIRAESGTNKTITLPRLVATFPELFAKVKIASTQMPVGFSKDSGLPPYLCFPSAPALFPRDEIGNQYMQSWRVWQQRFSLIIKAQQNNQTDFGALIRDNGLRSDQSRIIILTQLHKDYQNTSGRRIQFASSTGSANNTVNVLPSPSSTTSSSSSSSSSAATPRLSQTAASTVPITSKPPK